MSETVKGVKIKIGVDNKQAIKGLKQTEKSVNSMTKSAMKIGGAFLGFRAVTGLISSSISAFGKQEKAVAQLNASLKSTGGIVGYTSQELQGMASGLQKLTAYGDEEIISAQSMLLTFTKIGKEVFPELIERTLDLSTKMGQDLKASVVQLGKALNDPVANLGLLGKTGIQFTKVQKDMIKELWNSGKQMEAQKVILEELNNQFGGSAQAEAKTYTGQIKQLKDKFGDVSEEIGKVLAPAMLELMKIAYSILKPFDGLIAKYDALIKKAYESTKITKQFNKDYKNLSKDEKKLYADITHAVTKRFDKETELMKRKIKDMGFLQRIEQAKLIEEREKNRLEKIQELSIKSLNKQLGLNKNIKKEIIKTNKALNVTKKTDIKATKEQEKALKKHADMLKKIQEDYKDAEAENYADEQEELRDSIEEVNARFKEQEKVIEGDVSALETLDLVTGLTAEQEKKLKEETEKARKEQEKFFNTAFGGIDIIYSMSNAFKSLGLDSISEDFKNLGDIADDTVGVIKDLASGNYLGAIAGGFAILGDVVKQNDKYFKQFKDDAIQNIKELNGWTNTTDAEIEALLKLEKQMGDTHGATSVFLDTLIDGNMTLKNSDKWLKRIREILSDVDRGVLSADESVKEIGDSFEVWLKQAKKLGTTGSKEFFKFLDDLKGRGLEIAEINEYMAESMEAGYQGYIDFLKGDFSNATIDVFETMKKYKKKISDNQELISGIKGLEKALIGLSSTTKLTEKQFDSFEQGARDGYDKLIKQGFTVDEALKLMAPTLKRLKYLQSEFGLTVDESTQKLINEAEANGLLKPDPINRMADALEKFISLLSNKLGLATQNAGSGIDGLAGKVRGLAGSLSNLGGINPNIRVHNPRINRNIGGNNLRREVRGGNNIANTNNSNLTINVANNGKNDVVHEIITAIRTNKKNINGEIRNYGG